MVVLGVNVGPEGQDRGVVPSSLGALRWWRGKLCGWRKNGQAFGEGPLVGVRCWGVSWKKGRYSHECIWGDRKMTSVATETGKDNKDLPSGRVLYPKLDRRTFRELRHLTMK